MTKQEAFKIIEEENLHGYNFEGNNIKADEVGIISHNNKWGVYYSDEKANCRIIEEYDLEDDAIAHVID